MINLVYVNLYPSNQIHIMVCQTIVNLYDHKISITGYFNNVAIVAASFADYYVVKFLNCP